jgi:16S rRNA (cytosine967-C5)-methyltransferase
VSPAAERAPTATRVAALQALRRVRRGELADLALEAEAAGLSGRDRAWTQELLYGTLRLRGRLDHLLGAFVKGGVEGLEADVLDVLRLGAYQLREMGSVPPYAAVSESIELARHAGAPRAARLVSGVLHSLSRRGDEVAFPDLGADPVAHLSTWGSHPRWLVERWVERWGADEAGRLVERDNTRPELYLTPVGLEAGEAIERLAAAGIAAQRVPFAPGSLRLESAAELGAALAAVPAVVQDPAAALVVTYAAVQSGSTVLDLCAAPGGKAIGLTGDAGRVVAAELSLPRMRRLEANLERLGLRERVAVVVADGRQPPVRPLDAVLIDAPCTGTGTLRRHPDGRWRLRPDDLRALTGLQDALLDAAAACVRPGGLLVYSTCSLEREENEVRIDRFLSEHPTFSAEASPARLDPGLLTGAGWLQLLPQRQGVDGAFAARLRRAA